MFEVAVMSSPDAPPCLEVTSSINSGSLGSMLPLYAQCGSKVRAVLLFQMRWCVTADEVMITSLAVNQRTLKTLRV